MKTLTMDRKCPGGKGKALKNIIIKAKKEGYRRIIFKDPTKEGIINNLKTEIYITP